LNGHFSDRFLWSGIRDFFLGSSDLLGQDEILIFLEIQDWGALAVAATSVVVAVTVDDDGIVSKSIGVLAVVRDSESAKEVVIATFKDWEAVLIEIARRLGETSITDDRDGIAPLATITTRIVTTNNARDDLVAKRALKIDGTVFIIEVNSNIHTGDRGQATKVAIANIVVRARTAATRSWGVGAGGEGIATTIVPGAFILVNATSVTITVIASWAISAGAAFTGRVNAFGQRITTTVGRSTALINIGARGLAGTSVVGWAVRALETALRVGAGRKRIARAGIRIALIDINTAIITITGEARGWAITASA